MINYLKIKEIVLQAGNIMLKPISEAEIHEKGTADFVTARDIEVQQFIFTELKKRYPDIGFIGEEGTVEEEQEYKQQWILDPIDGTTNYIYGYNMSAISLALKDENEILFGVVYNPFTNELFEAVKGQGAFLNGEPIKVSQKNRLCDALVSVGTSPYYKELADDIFEIIKKIYMKTLDIRRMGSAALDLAYVACGRQDAYFEYNLKPWDYAAGYLLVKEAGGIVKTAKQEAVVHGKNENIVACCNEMIMREIAELLFTHA